MTSSRAPACFYTSDSWNRVSASVQAATFQGAAADWETPTVRCSQSKKAPQAVEADSAGEGLMDIVFADYPVMAAEEFE